MSRRTLLIPGCVAVVMVGNAIISRLGQPAPFGGIADQVAQVRGAVVHVAKVGPGGYGCQGSGCLLTSDGVLFTAKHVSDSEQGEYTVTLDDGRKFPVKYVIEDRENDVSLMKLELPPNTTLPFARMAQEDRLRVGDSVFVFGSPLGRDNLNTVSLGILSAMNRDLLARDGWDRNKRYGWSVMLQTTSPAFPGNSGGPVFNMRGEVIGVLVAVQAETLNFSVPVARFRDTIGTARGWFSLCRFHVVIPEMRGQGRNVGNSVHRESAGPPAPDPNGREDK